jgi:hypothetical protein
VGQALPLPPANLSFQESYFLAIRCGFFKRDCLRFPGFRFGLLMMNVPLP